MYIPLGLEKRKRFYKIEISPKTNTEPHYGYLWLLCIPFFEEFELLHEVNLPLLYFGLLAGSLDLVTAGIG